MKLYHLFTTGVIAKERPLVCPGLEKPLGVAEIKCPSQTKCKVVCDAGLVAMGKKAVKCKNGKWKGTLPECSTCTPPTDMTVDSLLDFQCRVNKKNVSLCNVKCSNSSNVSGYGEQFSKVKLTCQCAKNDEGVKECNWTAFDSIVDPSELSCFQGSTSDVMTTTTKAASTTMAHSTTTTKTSSVSTTTASTSTTAGIDCTPKADGTCGAAKAVESYMFVNFEGFTMSNLQVGIDPGLCHLDHIGNHAWVGVGSALSKETNGLGQTIVTRIDRCPDLSSYSKPTEVEVGVPADPASIDCKSDYTWTYKGSATKNNRAGYVATSPDGTYVLIAGVKEKSSNAYARWIVKLDAATGQEMWSIEMPTTNKDGLSKNKQAGYESVAFTSDGGFIAGGFANYQGEFPPFKSGGQVEGGTPLFQKFKANVAKRTTPFASPPTPEWTFNCDKDNCSSKSHGSMKTMRVYMDNGVEKVVSAPGTANDVIIVNVSDGSKSAYHSFGDSWQHANFQDIEPVIQNGQVTGFGVTGLDSTYVVPQGTGGCTKSSGCGTIFGHTSMLSADASKVEWKKTFNNFKGGEVEYAGLEPFSDAVVLTECWGLTTTVDAQGEPTGLAAACGQGIEGCSGYLEGIDQATLNACETDPRRGWRGAAVHVDLNGALTWYRIDPHRAYEFVDRAPNGQLTFLGDKAIGFSFGQLVL